MAATAPTANSQAPGTPEKKPLLPPEERFWQRHSPHNEFPLSSVGSVTLYVLMGLMIWAGIKFLPSFSSDPLSVGAIEFDPDVGGGGGDPSGVSGGTGDKLPENLGNPDPTQLAKEQNLPPLQPLLPKAVDTDAIKDIVAADETGDPILESGSTALANLSDIRQDTAKLLMSNLRDKGKGGTGTGGGQGTGTGTGTGSAKGPGSKAPLSERQKRVLRWNMVFDTRNGEDYRRQLQALGAILAIPSPDGQYLVIRDLRPPARPAAEDLQKLQRIFWVDSTPQSVHNLASALGLSGVPPHIVAFFPEELEGKLAAMEKSFARGRPESEIKETRFRVMMRAGKYEPVIVDQR